MHRMTFVSMVALFLLLLAPGAGRAAPDPVVDCQVATAKAVSTCIKKAAKASLTCYKKTGVACLPADAKLSAALAAAEAAIVDKCVDDAAVAAAGYAPLPPAGLGARLRASCSREVDAIAARSFGGPAAPLLSGASKDDTKCLLTAAKEAGKLVAKNLKQVGKCAGKVCDLDKVDAALAKASSKTGPKIDKKCADLASLVGIDTTAFVAEAEAQIVSATASSCDPLDTTHCMFPTTNDYFSVGDPSSTSARRLAFAVEATPANISAVSVDPTSWNVLDGFSVGPLLLLDNQAIDLATTGAPPITDLAASLDAASKVVLIDADTGEKQLVWIERDQSGPVAAERPLMIRVGRNLINDHRYIIALREMRDDQGALLAPSAVFAAYRDRTPTPQLPVEARRAHMESIFTTLTAAGVAREDLYLAWDFSTQSTDSSARKMLHMRDDAFTNVLGADSPAFTVDSIDEPFSPDILRRIDGTFQVPLYMEDAGIPGSALRLGPDGLPTNEGDFFTADFRCLVPNAATTGGGAPAIPGRPSLYGHGLLGSETQTSASHVQAFSSEHNFIMCGTKWTGFADEDAVTAVAVIQDFSVFPNFIGRQHQGVLNFMVLGRLLTHPNGFASDPAFQVGGESVIDPSALFYDGNSQGGILGGVLAAFSQDIERFVLGVPGINYSTLLRRSVDFDTFNVILEANYTNGVDRAALLSMAQIMWDQTDPNGHVRHTTSDTYPNTPPKKILYQVAFGDHQVAPVTAEIAARSNGALLHTPALSPGKVVPEVTPYYDIPAIPSYPYDGSALVIWDSGNPAPPTGNTPPAEITNLDPEWADLSACAMDHDSDPHECPRREPTARLQKSEFLKTGGAVVDTCAGAACLAPTP
jgi:hypothetical protein